MPDPIPPHELPHDIRTEPAPAPGAFDGEVNLPALESARGLAWTAVVLALLLPPVGMGVAWFCLGVARRSRGMAGCADAASSLSRIALLALGVGLASLVAWVAILVVASR